MASTPKSIILAICVWCVILAGVALTVKFLIFPYFEEKKTNELVGLTSSEGQYEHKLSLALDSFSGYHILRSSELIQELSNNKIEYFTLDDGANYQKRIEAIHDGKVQLAVFPINSLIQSGISLGKFPASIIYLIDETRGADAIVVNKNAVKDINDLNDAKAKIVLTPDSPAEFLSRVMIASFNLPNLPHKKWSIAEEGSSAVYKKMRADNGSKLRAYALWEPDVSRSLKDPNTKVLLDSSKFQGYIVDALVVQREFLVDNYDLVLKFVQSYARAAYKIKSKQVQSVIQDSKQTGDSLSRDEAEKVTSGIAWKNLLENYAHFGLLQQSHSMESLDHMITKISDVLVKTKAISVNPLAGKTQNLYYDKILRDLQQQNFHPGRQLNVLTGIHNNQQETLQTTQEAKALNEDQWNKLNRVGVLRVKPLTFGRGTARINIKSKRDLNQLAVTLKSWPHYYLTVIGQTQSGGDKTASLNLAKKRAESAASLLIQNGISENRIRTLSQIASSMDTSAQSVLFMVGEQ